MNVNTFEVIGMTLSIGAMVLALWYIQQESVMQTMEQAVVETQTGAVIVADIENTRAAVADAVFAASDATGDLKKLIINDVTPGDGPEVVEGDTVSVHYIGTLQNGQQFDNSYLSGAPFVFTVGAGRVIPGWEEGILGMQVGGQRIVVIPPELAYGTGGAGPIPADATLVFAIELLAIE